MNGAGAAPLVSPVSATAPDKPDPSQTAKLKLALSRRRFLIATSGIGLAATGTGTAVMWITTYPSHPTTPQNLTKPQIPTPLGKPLTGPTAGVKSVAFSPNGRTLAAGSYDNRIWLWDVTDPANTTAAAGGAASAGAGVLARVVVGCGVAVGHIPRCPAPQE